MRVLVKLVLGLAVPVLVVWLAGLLVGLSAGSAAAAVVLRSLGSLLALALLTRVLLRRDPPAADQAWLVPVAGLAAYAVSPQAWAGRALFGQLVVPAGLPSLLLDLVVWELVVVLVGRTVAPAEPEVERAPYSPGL